MIAQKKASAVVLCFDNQVSRFIELDQKFYDGVSLLRTYLDQCSFVLDLMDQIEIGRHYGHICHANSHRQRAMLPTFKPPELDNYILDIFRFFLHSIVVASSMRESEMRLEMASSRPQNETM